MRWPQLNIPETFISHGLCTVLFTGKAGITQFVIVRAVPRVALVLVEVNI